MLQFSLNTYLLFLFFPILGLRVHVDARSDRMNAKIRDAQRQKIPYMLVLGDKEIDCHSVALRKRSGENLGAIPLHQFIDLAKKEIAEKI